MSGVLKRTSENCHKVVEDVKKRTGGRTDILFTSDEHYIPCIPNTPLAKAHLL